MVSVYIKVSIVKKKSNYVNFATTKKKKLKLKKKMLYIS
jgi:hypothetical protein